MYYWSGHHTWVPFVSPAQLAGKKPEKQTDDIAPPEQSHLHSAGEVAGYHIQANDGEIGHVKDSLAENESCHCVISSWIPVIGCPDARF
jgi:hypothetical protein